MTLYRRQGVEEAGVKTIPKKKKCNEAKCLSGEPYKELRKEEKQKAKEKRKDIYSYECRLPKNSKKRLRKPSSVINAKK